MGLRGAVLVAGLSLGSQDGVAGSTTGVPLVQGLAASAPSLVVPARSEGFTLRPDESLTGPQRQFTYEPMKLSPLEMVSQFRAVKRGVGLDFGLGDTGNLHFNLYSGKDGFAHGKRWSAGGLDDAAPDDPADRVTHGARFWSLGASLDMVRFRSIDEGPARDSRIVVSPQLRIDLDALTGVCGDCEMLVQDTTWRGADSRATDSERVVQVSMRWRF